jgi:hypothetical protein
MMGHDMTGIDTVNAPQTARVDGCETNAVVAVLTRVLYLAAAPTFAVMAVLTSMSGGSADMMCSAAHGAWLNGMVPMYVLMSAFHSGPWLKWIIRR